MKACEFCNNQHNGSYGTGRFCNNVCARKYSIECSLKKPKKETRCKRCGCEIVVKNGTDPSYYFCGICRKTNYDNYHQEVLNRKISLVCEFCGKPFVHWHKIKFCSSNCKRANQSKLRTLWLQKNGTSNFSCIVENYSYGVASNLNLDSRLEQSAIIYLNDVFGATKIDRYNELLQFKDDIGINHFFTTDFYVERHNEKYIVEVKMPWIGTSDHIYNRYIPNKKMALNEHCISKGFQMIWLDLNFDKRMISIYNDVLNKKYDISFIPG